MGACLIFGLHNRLDYNKITLPLILSECKSSNNVTDLIIIDDNSTDGSSEWIQSLQIENYFEGRCTYKYHRDEIGNSTKQYEIAMNHIRKSGSEATFLANFCNDCLIPIGIVDELMRSMADKKVFAVGATVGEGSVRNINGVQTNSSVIVKGEIKDVSHIGIGLYRISVFEKLGGIRQSQLPNEKRFFGFTHYQNQARKAGFKIKKHEGVYIVELDRDERYSQLLDHVENGWTRNIIGKKPSVFNLAKK